MKVFENSLAPGGSAPDPLRGRPQKVFPRTKILATPLVMHALINFHMEISNCKAFANLFCNFFLKIGRAIMYFHQILASLKSGFGLLVNYYYLHFQWKWSVWKITVFSKRLIFFVILEFWESCLCPSRWIAGHSKDPVMARII